LWPGVLSNGRCPYEPSLRVITLPDQGLALPQAFKQGGRLGLLVRPMPGHLGIRAPFLGHDSRFAATPVRLAIRNSARMVFWCCTREADPARPFKMTLSSEFSPGSRSVRTALPLCTRALETMIRQHPEQYLWTRR